MQSSWLREEFTLYIRTVLTVSCLRNGTSRAQAAESMRGSMNVSGSEKGLLGSVEVCPSRTERTVS